MSYFLQVMYLSVTPIVGKKLDSVFNNLSVIIIGITIARQPLFSQFFLDFDGLQMFGYD